MIKFCRMMDDCMVKRVWRAVFILGNFSVAGKQEGSNGEGEDNGPCG